jgi:CMP-N-acetylneuraminic acid synthetase
VGKQVDDIVVIVQARLSSERCLNKMIKPFAGTTLSDVCIQKILNSNIIPQKNFYFSVYEPELADIAHKYGVNIFDRSKKSAFSEGTPLCEMYEWWNKLDYKYCVLINACAPFLKIETIDKFIEFYLNSDSDGLFGVIEKKNYFWNFNYELLTPLTEDCMNTKTVQTTYEAAHCLYAGKMSEIGNGIWMGDLNNDGIELFVMNNEFETFDIDYQWQFNIAQQLYEGGLEL